MLHPAWKTSTALLLACSINIAISSSTCKPTATSDPASACYGTALPSLTPSIENRTTPWGTPSITFSNGTTCCDSLDQVRAGINEVDDQLLSLLSQRASYVREATRFKATLSAVDVPSRDAEVIQEAVDDAPQYGLPQTIAQAVFAAVINGSVPFEQCVFNEYDSSASK